MGALDDFIANLSCIFAVGLVIFPTAPQITQSCAEVIKECFQSPHVCQQVSELCSPKLDIANLHSVLADKLDTSIVHFLFAAGYFLTLIFFAWFLFTKAKSLPEDCDPQKKKRNMVYKTCALIMAACAVLIPIYSIFLEGKRSAVDYVKPVLILESLAVFAFGISWFTKSGLFIYKDCEEE